MSEENPYNVDINRETVRGRACPVCRGKIIPSNRAVYESKANPDEVFPVWECERCGYSEVSEKPVAAKKKH